MEWNNSFKFCRGPMLVEERRQRVLDLVSTRGFVALADLAKSVNVSESTIRRDLDYWHQQGTVRRTHGGGIYVGDATVLPALEERSSSQLEEKRAIARRRGGTHPRWRHDPARRRHDHAGSGPACWSAARCRS